MIDSVKGILEKQKYGDLSSSLKKEDYQEFSSEEDCERWAEALYKEWAEAYKSIFNRTAMYRQGSILRVSEPAEYYFGYCFSRINAYLRSKETTLIEEEMKRKIVLLMAAIYSTPKTDRNLILYRLVSKKMIAEMIRLNRTEGFPYCERGFMSTSMVKRNCASECGNHEDMLKIYVPSGIHAIFANLIKRRSEIELLLPPEMFLKMIRAPYRDVSTGKNIYEVQLINYHVY